ncbi:MAG: Smr/MutS family protein [Deltaproteobacteria bacterium]|nr:Smr/MutS family protein [Deltaproteobacteria bacterium]
MTTTPTTGGALGPACLDKTRSDLEWDRLLDAIASRCSGPLGERATRSLPFCSSCDAVRVAMQETHEAFDLLVVDEPLPSGGGPVIRDAVDRLRAGGALGPVELRDIAKALGLARTLRRFLQARRDRAPNLLRACETDTHLDALEEHLTAAFDPDGTLSDKASPRLRELRSERQAARERLLRKLEDIMQRYSITLQDTFITEREGRFVLPVRSDSHERFTGIVHGTSASGQTLYMEPRAVIPLGNRLKVVDADIEREENAIYASLSAELADQVESIAAAELALAHAELRAACARLTLDLDLSFPEVVDEPLLDLRAARHPLLQLDGVRVVPNTIRAEPGKAVIVSGPNAGGKTVALKTLGLVALMLRAGLPLPCKSTSQVGVFEFVASDMGDDQSIAKNLSTFSAHVRNLAAILEGTFRGALVLLDEVATGTDPREGEALASAVLDGLCARGGAVVCTTHYEGLKALALGDPRFVNASVGFDLATMSPTFDLMIGIPGASSALAIAKRFGMPSLIVERAERFLGSEERGFEQLVRRLNDERRALELARAAAEREQQESERVRKQLESELELARTRERRQISKETESLMSAVRRAREELRWAESRLKSRKLDEPRLREAARSIERVAKQVAIGGELEPPRDGEPILGEPLESHDLHKGLRVYLPRIRCEGEVVDVLSGGQVRVAAGAVKLIATVEELRRVGASKPAAPERPVRKPPRVAFDAASDPQSPIQTSENKCDLRGLRVDEAISMAQQFLDRSLNEGRRVAFLIHGHGTGALRDAIRTELASSPYVLRSRAGEQSEGGEGVTVVWLR